MSRKGIRFAIYTRVSTDSGLEQEFNSLHNQREAGEAFVKSQAHEGWVCLTTTYDDGGYSGGSMDRPALQRLLADIRARLVDVVVVYKVDRLTRSLADFAKLVELFDEHSVSFVSVTQAFNTTNSMGRLTLNVLLSFAQFEREVTGERIRDKIAASKKKGMWMGGNVPLGYVMIDKRLAVDPEEAGRVRLIFKRYLELGCLSALIEDLRERGILTKQVSLTSGAMRGGIPFTKGPLRYLLRNRVYVGEIGHKGKYFPGEHEPIVDRALFDAVQAKLTDRAVARTHARINNAAILTGYIFDDRGNRMTPTTCNKGGMRYRYYTSQAVMQGRKSEAGSVPRVSAPDLEGRVLAALVSTDQGALTIHPAPHDIQTARDLIQSKVSKLIIRPGMIELALYADNVGEEILALEWSPQPVRARRELVVPDQSGAATRPIRAEARARFLQQLVKARLWLEQLVSGEVTSTEAIAQREKCSERKVRMTLGLAFLSPELIKAVVEGRLPHGCTVSTLGEVPLNWTTQRSLLMS